MDYAKNQFVTLKIEDIGIDGEGIGHIDGYTFFVKDAVIGDTVEARVTKPSKNYAYARLEKVITPSDCRVEAVCPVAKTCGGCQIQTVSYERQLEFKQSKVRNNLKRIGGFDEEKLDRIMDNIVGMDNPWNYRNKAQYPIGYDKNGKLIAGFYAGRTHSIISCEDCAIGDKVNKQVLDIILSHMNSHKITAYDEEKKQGLVRHVLIRKGFTSGEVMVCLILNTRPKKDLLNKALAKRTISEEKNIVEYDFMPAQAELLLSLSAVPGMTSVSVNINTENTNVIMGESTYCIWGKPYIRDTIHVRDMLKEGYPFTGKEIEFSISPRSFYQVNPVQTEKLYSLALLYAGLTGKEAVWDLYCGIGTISMFLAGKAGKVYGVEIIPQAIDDAKENAERNHIGNAEFFVGKAEEVLPEFYKNAGNRDKSDIADMTHPDVIVVDPPRKGCDEICLQTMIQMAPEKIVYVSCDSATLARDLKYLCGNGYELVKARPVDMFPHTVHVETVVLLSKLHEAKHHVSVKLDMDEMDITSAESKATYEEIKKYVAEHNGGMKVSSLNIAQVKREYGIIERENYNIRKATRRMDCLQSNSTTATNLENVNYQGQSKSEDSKQPQCPDEKKKAIKEALIHFGMI